VAGTGLVAAVRIWTRRPAGKQRGGRGWYRAGSESARL